VEGSRLRIAWKFFSEQGRKPRRNLVRENVKGPEGGGLRSQLFRYGPFLFKFLEDGVDHCYRIGNADAGHVVPTLGERQAAIETKDQQ
jgi:hypothetical protein